MKSNHHCEGKQKFSSFKESSMVAKRVRRNRTGNNKVKVYKCKSCGGWHLGGTYTNY